MRLTSRNSDMGRRLANRDEMEVERSPSKRPERLTLDVRASIGMLKRDMMDGEVPVGRAGGDGGGNRVGEGS